MSDNHSYPRTIPVIAGPTAVGKTAVSLGIASVLGSEVISADSRQVFRQMKVGTARPDDADLKGIPHHFLNDRNLDDPFSAGIFAREAEQKIGQIIERGHSPLVVGGSTLYLHALTEGLADIPQIRPGVRSELNARLETEGVQHLYDELLSVDPEFASTLDNSKSQRIVRGLEVWRGTGIRLSDYFKQKPSPAYQYTFYVLDRERRDLYDRINRRVDNMISEGLIDEVRSILDAGFSVELNALQTIGYREVIQNLNGEIDLSLMTEEIKKNTRRYAKRQNTWFRRIKNARRITVKSSGEKFSSNTSASDTSSGDTSSSDTAKIEAEILDDICANDIKNPTDG